LLFITSKRLINKIIDISASVNSIIAAGLISESTATVDKSTK